MLLLVTAAGCGADDDVASPRPAGQSQPVPQGGYAPPCDGVDFTGVLEAVGTLEFAGSTGTGDDFVRCEFKDPDSALTPAVIYTELRPAPGSGADLAAAGLVTHTTPAGSDFYESSGLSTGVSGIAFTTFDTFTDDAQVSVQFLYEEGAGPAESAMITAAERIVDSL